MNQLNEIFANSLYVDRTSAERRMFLLIKSSVDKENLTATMKLYLRIYTSDTGVFEKFGSIVPLSLSISIPAKHVPIHYGFSYESLQNTVPWNVNIV